MNISRQGQKRGDEQTRETVEDTCTRRGAQRRAAETGGQRVWEKSRWATYHKGRGGGERVLHIERGDKKMNGF